MQVYYRLHIKSKNKICAKMKTVINKISTEKMNPILKKEYVFIKLYICDL